MYSNIKKLDEFLKNYSGPQNMLRDVYMLEKEKTTEEIERENERFVKEKDYLLKEISEMFYDTSHFKRPPANFKHKLELLEHEDPDYTLVRDSLGCSNRRGSVAKYKEPKIYKVKTSNDGPAVSDAPSLLLLHGTAGRCVQGILKEGFRPSQCGSCGPGVYMTNSFQIASGYGRCFVSDEGVAERITYLFVNKVRNTGSEIPEKSESKDTFRRGATKNKTLFVRPMLHRPKYKNGKNISAMMSLSLIKKESLKEQVAYEPVLKVFEVDARSGMKNQTRFENTRQDSFDGELNRIVSGTFSVPLKQTRLFVAHHQLVTPAYLVEIKEEVSTGGLAKHLLYDVFKVPNFDVNSGVFQRYEDISRDDFNRKTVTERDVCSLKLLIAEFVKEMEANQQIKNNFIKSNFGSNITLFAQQLTFEMSALLTAGAAESFNYKPEDLQTSDEDYQFVLSSLKNQDCKEIPKVLHVFRINPVDQNETQFTTFNYFYLHGITSNNVVNVLTSGYPMSDLEFTEQCKERCVGKNINRKNCSCYCSSSLSRELSKGVSYCNVENKLEKLSFVFVTSEKTTFSAWQTYSDEFLDYWKKLKEYSKSSHGCSSLTAGRDSKGCTFATNSIKSSFGSQGLYPGMWNCENQIDLVPVKNKVPAYLVVFSM